MNIVDAFVRFFMRYVPDSFVVAIVLTLLTFVLAIFVADYSPQDTINAWGDGFWNLLKFTNQITLTLLLGYAVANTEPAKKSLAWLAGLIPSAGAAYVAVSLVTGLCAMVSWGLSLITAGVFARAVGEAMAKKGIKVHYPLLVASSFSGFIVWHQGLSGSVTLTIATAGHFLESQIGIIDIDQTIFSMWNLSLAATLIITMPLFMLALKPSADKVDEIPEALLKSADTEAEPEANTSEVLTPAQKLEQAPWLNWLIVLIGFSFIYTHFVSRGHGLTLDIFNFGFLMFGIMMAGSPIKFVQIIMDGGRVAAVFLVQYPLYSGIAALMAASGLANLVVEFFVTTANADTLAYYSFLSGGLLNIFIPSGGGQWAVQGPIMMTAAQTLGADLPRVAMSVALGDQWTNLIQPLTIVPVIAIAQVPLRAMLGYSFLAFLYAGVVISIWLIAF